MLYNIDMIGKGEIKMVKMKDTMETYRILERHAIEYKYNAQEGVAEISNEDWAKICKSSCKNLSYLLKGAAEMCGGRFTLA